MRNDLKVSVITVCFNAELSIEATIHSVLCQNYENIEYLVIDGASKDKTLRIVQKYHSRVKIISEPDNGLFDAMNKGLRLASGDVICFLNADDKFYDEHVIRSIVDTFNEYPEAGLVYGNLFFVNTPEGMWFDYDEYNKERKKKFDCILYSMPHQATFARRSVFDQVGGFDIQFPRGADYDWFLRCWDSGIKMHYMNRYMTFFSLMGVSARQRYDQIPERIRLVQKNTSPPTFLLYAIIASARCVWKLIYEYLLWPIKKYKNRNHYKKFQGDNTS